MTQTKKTLIRLPFSLYGHIEKRAKASLRSVNSEMIALLKIGLTQNQLEAEHLIAADSMLRQGKIKQPKTSPGTA
jgi:hypothetical protein